MAINETKRITHQLDSAQARLAGLASAALSGLCAAGLLTYLLTHTNQGAGANAVQGIWMLVFALMAAVGVCLTREAEWAQPMALVFHLVVAEAAAMLVLSDLLWGAPPWWKTFLNAPMLAVVAPALVLNCAVVALIVKASAAISRLRYGAMVAVSIAVALALVILVNLLASKEQYRKDYQAISRYGISERTRKILDSLTDKIRLTCAYTIREGDDADSKDSKSYHDQVVELLDEMRLYNPDKVEILDVVKDADKALVLKNLGQKQGSKAEEHKKLMADFVAVTDKMLDSIEKDRARWTQLNKAGSYLTYWRRPEAIEMTLSDQADHIRESRKDIDAAMKKTGVIDYAALVEQGSKLLTAVQAEFKDQVKDLDALGKTGAAIQANSKSAQESLTKCAAVVGPMMAALGTGEPNDVAGTLKKFSAACKEAAKQVRATADALDNLAGKQNLPILKTTPSWQILVQLEDRAGRADLGTYFRYMLAGSIDGEEDSLAVQSETYATKANPKTQADLIQSLRKVLPTLEKKVQEATKRAGDSITKLATVDAASQDIFKQAADGKLFDSILKPAAEMLDRAAKLPKLENTDLSARTSENNIVLIEAAGKTDVVSFNEVWPQKEPDRGTNPAAVEKYKTRVFNGDSAIASKLLLMTQSKPFATVLLAFYEPPMDPQMMQMMHTGPPQGPIPSSQLSELRKRLAQANFEVKDWNLTGEMPADEDDRPSGASTQPTSAKAPKPPKVLLLVPPAEKLMPSVREEKGFGLAQVDKIRELINSGTPAVVLMTTSSPRDRMGMGGEMAMDSFLDYFRQDWGINVLNGYRLVEGVPDETLPGRFSIDVLGFNWMPMSNFSDHPIGKPLLGQRMLWVNVCPIETALGGKFMEHKGVKLLPLLTVPGGRNDIWATSNLEDLIAMVTMQQGGTVEASFGTSAEGKDLRPPLTIALAATRGADPQRNSAPSRLVMLGVGGSMIDSYIRARVPQLSAKGGISFDDPPKGNLDLVANSIYWLVGDDQYIAAGPAQIRPVASIDPLAMTIWWVLCVVILPVGIGAVGIGVLMRRSH